VFSVVPCFWQPDFGTFERSLDVYGFICKVDDSRGFISSHADKGSPGYVRLSSERSTSAKTINFHVTEY
jgi:hypothetical protein